MGTRSLASEDERALEERALYERCFAVLSAEDDNGSTVEAVYPTSATDAEVIEDNVERHARVEKCIEKALRKRTPSSYIGSTRVYAALPPWYSKSTPFSQLDAEEQRTVIQRAVSIPPVKMRKEGPVYVRTLAVSATNKEAGYYIQYAFLEGDVLYCALHRNSTGGWCQANACTICKKSEAASERELKDAFHRCPICGTNGVCLHPTFVSQNSHERFYLRIEQIYLVHVTSTDCYHTVINRADERTFYCLHDGQYSTYACSPCKSVNQRIRKDYLALEAGSESDGGGDSGRKSSSARSSLSRSTGAARQNAAAAGRRKHDADADGDEEEEEEEIDYEWGIPKRIYADDFFSDFDSHDEVYQHSASAGVDDYKDDDDDDYDDEETSDTEDRRTDAIMQSFLDRKEADRAAGSSPVSAPRGAVETLPGPSRPRKRAALPPPGRASPSFAKRPRLDARHLYHAVNEARHAMLNHHCLPANCVAVCQLDVALHIIDSLLK